MRLMLTSDSNFTGDIMCYWHPLTKWVNYVLRSSINTPFNNKNFIEKLNHLKEKDEELRRIFTPLDIVCYDNLALFRYKKYLDLKDLDCNIEDFFSYEGGLYRECRSVVFDEFTGNVVLASLAKFKNYGEDTDTYKQWSVGKLNTLYNECFRFYITDKMDGSYTQFTWDKKRNKIIGSTSKMLNPDESWILKTGYSLLNNANKLMIKNFPEWTFVYEFIHPENPIVVHYNKSQTGLYLIGARNKFTGQELGFDILRRIVNSYNMEYVSTDSEAIKMVEYYTNETLESVLSQSSESIPNKEGWVVDCWNCNLPFNHLRFKIKTDEYVLMHKAVDKLSSIKTIIQIIADDKWDDFYSKVPESHRESVEEIKEEIIRYCNIISASYNSYFGDLLATFLPDKEKYNDRKTVMLWIKEKVPQFLRGYVINCYLHKPNYILKNGGGGYRSYKELKELAEKCSEDMHKYILMRIKI